LLAKRALFLLNAAFAIAILDLISQLYLPSFVNNLGYTDGKVVLLYFISEMDCSGGYLSVSDDVDPS
jgi:hypothetical protein